MIQVNLRFCKWIAVLVAIAGLVWPDGGPQTIAQRDQQQIKAGSFYYCALPYPTGNPCNNCTMSIYWEYQERFGQQVYVQLYQNCGTNPTSYWCWQTSYTGSPTPTCTITSNPCPGGNVLYDDGSCTSVNAYNPNEPCSMFLTYPGYNSGVAGSVNGVDCSNMPTQTYSS